jgi:hypothetical protein
MQKLIFFLLFTIFCFGQDQSARVFFIDGTSKKGLGLIAGNKVKFRLKSEDKWERLTSKELLGVEFYEDDYTVLYEYIQLPKTSWLTLVEVVTEGEITIYYLYTPSSSFQFNNINTPDINHTVTYTNFSNWNNPTHDTFSVNVPGTSAPVDLSKSKQDIYFLRKSSGEITKIRTDLLINWKKRMSKYFQDCDALVRKIQNNEFDTTKIKEMVEFYNDICVGE